MELLWHTKEIVSEPHEFPASQERLWPLLNRKSHHCLLSFQLPPKTQLSTGGKWVVFKRLSLEFMDIALFFFLDSLLTSRSPCQFSMSTVKCLTEHRLFYSMKELGFENDMRQIMKVHSLGLLSDELFAPNIWHCFWYQMSQSQSQCGFRSICKTAATKSSNLSSVGENYFYLGGFSFEIYFYYF